MLFLIKLNLCKCKRYLELIQIKITKNIDEVEFV